MENKSLSRKHIELEGVPKLLTGTACSKVGSDIESGGKKEKACVILTCLPSFCVPLVHIVKDYSSCVVLSVSFSFFLSDSR